MLAPIVETERLRLRAFRADDFASFAAMYADPEVVRHTGDSEPRTSEQSWSTFLVIPGHWHYLGFGAWAIEEKASGRHIGDIGFTERRRDRGIDLDGVPEMGWALATSSFGKGYATEAVQAALVWGRAHFGARRVIALTSEQNTASIRVAQKCGFREFRRGLSAGRSRIFFERML
jgi:RimJ/RimL family protein N-acetyltransferase